LKPWESDESDFGRKEESGRDGKRNEIAGGSLSDSRKLILGVGVWVLGITALHLWLNFNWSVLLNDRLPENQRRMYVAYIPVT
jgi:hypothetical protein